MYAFVCVHRTYIDSKLERQIDRCLHAYIHMHMSTLCVCMCVCVCVHACVRASSAQRIDHVDERIPLRLGLFERFNGRIDVRNPFVLDPFVVCA